MTSVFELQMCRGSFLRGKDKEFGWKEVAANLSVEDFLELLLEAVPS
jgi:hypothetical protein